MLNNERFLLPFKLIALGFLAIFFLAACAGTGLPKPPLAVPVKLDKVGVVADFQFEVSDHVVYWYFLEFKYPKDDKVEEARVRKLLGNSIVARGREPGTPTPVILTISRIDEQEEKQIYKKDIVPVLTSFGVDNFGKMLGHCDLPIGVYRARLENLRDSFELNRIPIYLTITKPSKFKFSFDQKTADKSRSCPQ